MMILQIKIRIQKKINKIKYGRIIQLKQMSGFIKFYFEEKQIIKGVQTEIISPDIKKLRSPMTRASKFFVKQTEKFLDQCKSKEINEAIKIDKIGKLNSYKSIKKKLADYSKTPVSSAFEKASRTSKNSPIVSVKQQQNKVYLLNKYNVSLALKLQAIYEAQRIQQQKQNLINWKNSTCMNAVNSPNFRKMNFLIEKIYEKKSESSNPNIRNFKPYIRSQENSITKSQKNSRYQPFSTSKSKLW